MAVKIAMETDLPMLDIFFISTRPCNVKIRITLCSSLLHLLQPPAPASCSSLLLQSPTLASYSSL